MQKTQTASSPTAGTTMSQAEAKRITDRLQNFYTNMKGYKAGGIRSLGKTTSGEMFTVDSATYLIEGAFNLLAVTREENREEESISFEITEPLSAGNLISEENVADAFWKTQQGLMALYDAVIYADKVLDFMELRAVTNGGNVTFTVTGKVTMGILSNNCSPLSSIYPASKAFAINGGGSTSNVIVIPAFNLFHYAYGQGTFSGTDVINKSYSSVNPKAPDAATLLRQYGKAKYYNCYLGQQCGYYVGVDIINNNGIPPSNVAGNPTVSNPGGVVFNKNMWNARIQHDQAVINSPINDLLEDAKTWLTPAVMDFYIDQIPGIIAGNIPSGKSLYDFNITKSCTTCTPTIDPLIDVTGTIYGYTDQNHRYYVYYAVFVPYCGMSPSLPNM